MTFNQPHEERIYNYIKQYYQCEELDLEDIQFATGHSRDTVKRVLNKFAKLGIITIKQTRVGNKPAKIIAKTY